MVSDSTLVKSEVILFMIFRSDLESSEVSTVKKLVMSIYIPTFDKFALILSQ
ncbi:hypothetical protein G134_1537 [Lactobacillus delbrueckii subsp. lactis CRL581]|nr:hypothetical protein G134_1537 [Lactobacillus delbrueckii subsp. lactis CRL581]